MSKDDFKDIPEDVQERIAELVAQFIVDHGVEHDAVVMFLVQVIEVYEEYQRGRLIKHFREDN